MSAEPAVLSSTVEGNADDVRTFTPSIWLRARYFKPHATKRCSRCKQERYCSGECQKAAWTSHRARCCTEEFNSMLKAAQARGDAVKGADSHRQPSWKDTKGMDCNEYLPGHRLQEQVLDSRKHCPAIALDLIKQGCTIRQEMMDMYLRLDSAIALRCFGFAEKALHAYQAWLAYGGILASTAAAQASITAYEKAGLYARNTGLLEEETDCLANIAQTWELFSKEPNARAEAAKLRIAVAGKLEKSLERNVPTDCAICLEDLGFLQPAPQDKPIVFLGCLHCLHKECADSRSKVSGWACAEAAGDFSRRGFAAASTNVVSAGARQKTSHLLLGHTRQYCTAASVASSYVAETGLAAGMSPGARRAVASWLGFSAGWVFTMVVLGGVTRLTRSGLSMTDWKFTGEHWPSSQKEWDAAFGQYKASPEFQRVNRSMSLTEFKFIYGMEYAHRMWGRALGLIFLGPALFFTARGWITRPLGARLGLLFAAGGCQGLVGWWMVKSGLEEPREQWETPRVSPYRLAAHLTTAFLIYSGLLWTTLSVAFPRFANTASSVVPAQPEVLLAAKRLRRWMLPLTGVISVTALSGAFVAGLQAGHAYNDFPLMNGRWFPEDYWQVPGWQNVLESPAAVQLHHRLLAATSLAAVTLTAVRFAGAPLPRVPRNLLLGVAALTTAQVALGISTLMLNVPVSLGSLHQANAMALLSLVICSLFALRPAASTLSPAAAAVAATTLRQSVPKAVSLRPFML
ncbi:hypothetical protein WJX84_000621 [Apatococcus fuscideae]|uniref:MYND-type domain-containing protein n=1 Tax=Apatococcus fuscideae TaxID=2026836 RepID=A0AAW1TGM9_9CHLO